MSADETHLTSSLHSERNGFRGIGDPYQNYQEKRRRNALQRQKVARLHSSNRARTLALEPGQQEDGPEESLSVDDNESELSRDGTTATAAEDAEMEPSTSYAAASSHGDAPMRGSGGRSGSRGRGGTHASGRRQQQQGQGGGGGGGVRAYGQQYGNELMQPEWMTDVPTDLATNWLVMPRPEGMRCLLVTSRGRTVSWLRNGAPLHRFASHLPGGSPATAAGCSSSAGGAGVSGDYCILDCIFHPPNNTYYVLDLLCWRGYALYDTAAEFRTFWLDSKFREEGLMPPAAATEAAAAAAASGGLSPVGMPPPPAAAGAAGGHVQRSCDGAAAAQSGDVDTEMGGDGVAAGGAGGRRGGLSRRGRHKQQQQQQRQQSEQQAPSVSYRIVPLPVRPCTLEGLRAAYGKVPPPPAATAAASPTAATEGPNPWVGSCAVGTPMAAAAAAAAGGMAVVAEGQREAAVEEAEFEFVRDGLYLLHRQGHYCPGPGPTPLALLWKDLGCSRYLLDTDAKGQPLEHQAIVLSYRADRTVATEDEPPVVLGRLPEGFVAAMGNKLQPGRLLRFTIREGGITFHEGRPAGADLHYEGPANQRRGRADSFSKILFQRLARTAPITAAALAAAVAAGPQPPAATVATEWTVGAGAAGWCFSGASELGENGRRVAGDGEMAVE